MKHEHSQIYDLKHLGLGLCATFMLAACSAETTGPEMSKGGIIPTLENGLLEPEQTIVKDYVDYSKNIRDKSQVLRSDGRHFGMLSDANGDGKLDFEEWTHHRYAGYIKWDKNLDGLLSRTEFHERGGSKKTVEKSKQIYRKFDANDKDGDGKLTYLEFGEVWRSLFKRTDKDGDGFISGVEMKIKQDLK